MTSPRRVLILLVLFAWPLSTADGEVLIRWDQNQVPAVQSLGISTLLIPATNTAAVEDAVRKGYRVYLAAEAPALAELKLPTASLGGIVLSGTASPGQLQAWRLVPFQHRDGQTEFVLPELRVGGRVFLSRDGPFN